VLLPSLACGVRALPESLAFFVGHFGFEHLGDAVPITRAGFNFFVNSLDHLVGAGEQSGLRRFLVGNTIRGHARSHLVAVDELLSYLPR
jgi:hypothetical protein